MSRPCPECGRTWDDRATFCGQCGAALTDSAGHAPATGGGGGTARAGRRDSVWATVTMAGGLVAVVVLGAVLASTTRSPAPSVGADEVADDRVDLPDADDAPTATVSEDLPPELLATCGDGDDATGCVRWIQRGPSVSTAGQQALALVSRHGPLVVADGDQVRSLDPTTGTRRWAASVDGAVQALDTVGDDTVLVSTPEGVRVLDGADGDVRWTVTGRYLPRTAAGRPMTDVVVLTGTDGRLTGHDVADGTEVWSTPIAEPPQTIVPLDDDLALVGDAVADVASGRLRWEVEGFAAFAVAASRDRVVVVEDRGPDDARVVVRAAATGRRVAELPLDPRQVRSAAVVDGAFVVRDDDGTVAFDLRDGSTRWRRPELKGGLLVHPPAVSPYPGMPAVQVPSPVLALRRTDGAVVLADPATGTPSSVLDQPTSDRLQLGAGTVTEHRVVKIDDEGLRVFDRASGRLLLDATVRSPQVVRTSPLLVLVGGRLVRLDLPTDTAG